MTDQNKVILTVQGQPELTADVVGLLKKVGFLLMEETHGELLANSGQIIRVFRVKPKSAGETRPLSEVEVNDDEN